MKMTELESLAKRVQNIKEMRDIQGQNGNYNCDDYMIGLYNGLEMAVSIIEMRDPVFKSTKDVRDRTKVLLRDLLESIKEDPPQVTSETQDMV